MADTYTLISSVTVGAGGASSIDFTSIPATYTDLLIKSSTRDTAAGANNGGFTIKINSDTGTNYSARSLYGSGSGTGSSNQASLAPFSVIASTSDVSAGNTASTFSNIEVYIPNYAGSNNKSISMDVVNENNATAAWSGLAAFLWANTAAITAINIKAASNFDQYSTFYLYGIKNS